jgi:nitroreductase
MMSTLEDIFSRRSIRKYKPQAVEQDKLTLLIKAAMYAPSARNTRPWHFIVVNERSQLDSLSEIHPYARMLKTATLAILVCGDTTLESSLEYLIQNCSAATQNILLAATSIGLGSVWLGIQPREARIRAMIDYFKLPPNILPITLIAIGYPDEEKSEIKRFDSNRIKYNGW